MAENLDANDTHMQLPISPGMSVLDVHGRHVGHVGAGGIQGDSFMLRHGQFMQRDIFIQLGVVTAVDDAGVHLALTHKQVTDLASANPPGFEKSGGMQFRHGGWSDLGEVDLNTGVPAGAPAGTPPTRVPNFPDGNNVAGTITDTGVPTGLPFRSKVDGTQAEDQTDATDATAGDSDRE